MTLPALSWNVECQRDTGHWHSLQSLSSCLDFGHITSQGALGISILPLSFGASLVVFSLSSPRRKHWVATAPWEGFYGAGGLGPCEAQCKEEPLINFKWKLIHTLSLHCILTLIQLAMKFQRLGKSSRNILCLQEQMLLTRVEFRQLPCNVLKDCDMQIGCLCSPHFVTVLPEL